MKMKFYKTVQFLSVVFCLLLGSCDPFKVTDPHDPRFDPMKFEFNDYKNDKQMAEVMRVLFSIGATRNRIDGFLVDIGNAHATDVKGQKYFSLGFSVDQKISTETLRHKSSKVIQYSQGGNNPKFVWLVVAFYDDQERVIQIVCGNEVVFEERN